MKYTKEMLERSVKKSVNFESLATELGMTMCPKNKRSYLKKRIALYGIDVSHFTEDRRTPVRRITVGEILCGGYKIRARTELIRSTLISLGVEYKCSECGQPPVWNGKPLTLQIDHINGDWTNNSFENLRFMCLHCHSQTETFGSKNMPRKSKVLLDLICKGCGVTFRRKSHKDYCRGGCYGRTNPTPTKGVYPSRDELRLLLDTHPLEKVAKDIGVSGNALRKRCFRMNITEFKPRGYWQKLKAAA